MQNDHPSFDPPPPSPLPHGERGFPDEYYLDLSEFLVGNPQLRPLP